jgi:predicted AAA+ superfamily ATPase
MNDSHIKRYLSLDLSDGQSCFLWGARKTGKSTFLKERYPTAVYVDLLKADDYATYVKEPARLRHSLQDIHENKIIVIDEIQKIPILLDEVHYMIEENKNFQFILCGSSNRRLKVPGTNLLGGRALRYQFVPLCYPEINKLDWKRIFNHGLIPSHYTADNPEARIASYIHDYLLTEVHVEAALRRKDTFARFVNILGFSQGETINFSNIARDCGVDSKTVRTYFEILEDMYIGYFVYPFRKKSKRRTIQEMPKFYIFDTGIASYLKNFRFKEMTGTEAGKAFEHYIYLELMAYKLLNQKRDDITYWRTSDGLEVDFVVQDLAIEVKISNSLRSSDLKGLKAFGEDFDHQLHVVSFTPMKLNFELGQKKVTIWPVEEFLMNLWAGKLWK